MEKIVAFLGVAQLGLKSVLNFTDPDVGNHLHMREVRMFLNLD